MISFLGYIVTANQCSVHPVLSGISQPVIYPAVHAVGWSANDLQNHRDTLSWLHLRCAHIAHPSWARPTFLNQRLPTSTALDVQNYHKGEQA
jgi:hypothetical protein